MEMDMENRLHEVIKHFILTVREVFCRIISASGKLEPVSGKYPWGGDFLLCLTLSCGQLG
jgi:hypothetical protein